ncbi:MAG: ornithine cyclodeaminase family protein [Chloroflexi bacterium]|nr:ornithine cyclodeaminase family protein [Chloroflexota bacterium]
MTLFLTEAQVEQILTMPDAMRVVEDALRQMGESRAHNRPRQRVRVPNGTLQVMPAGLPTRGYVGFKYYTSFRAQTRFWFHLIDASTGDVLSILQADRLGQQRTGAASGVATKYLAREDASIVGIIGTGWQAESQLQAVCLARPMRVAKCYSRDVNRRKSFAEKMSAQTGVNVTAVDSAEQAVRDADVVIAITSSREPVVRGEWLKSGAHVNAAGANRLEARELDDAVIQRSAFVCVDSIEQAKIEASDLVSPIEQGILAWERVYELGQVVAGRIVGRNNREQVTLFKSLGIAVEDVAVGAWVYEQARSRKIGKEIGL